MTKELDNARAEVQLQLLRAAVENFFFALAEFYRADFHTEADVRDKAVAAEEILRHLLPGPPPRLPFERKP